MSTQRERFLEVLCRNLTDQAGVAELDMSQNLRSLGLNSMRAVDLVIELEEELDITFPDDLFHDETFATGQSLWDALAPLIPDRAPR
jgi:acyl carrier protein